MIWEKYPMDTASLFLGIKLAAMFSTEQMKTVLAAINTIESVLAEVQGKVAENATPNSPSNDIITPPSPETTVNTPTNGRRHREGTKGEAFVKLVEEQGKPVCLYEIHPLAVAKQLSVEGGDGKQRTYSTLSALLGDGRLKAKWGPNPSSGKGKKKRVLYYFVENKSDGDTSQEEDGSSSDRHENPPVVTNDNEKKPVVLRNMDRSPPRTATPLREIVCQEQWDDLTRKVLCSLGFGVNFEKLIEVIKSEASQHGYDALLMNDTRLENGVRRSLGNLEKAGLVANSQSAQEQTYQWVSQTMSPEERQVVDEESLPQAIIELIAERQGLLGRDDIFGTLVNYGSRNWRCRSETISPLMMKGAVEQLLRDGYLREDGPFNGLLLIPESERAIA